LWASEGEPTLKSQRAGEVKGRGTLGNLVDPVDWNRAIATNYHWMSYDNDEVSRITRLAGFDLLGNGEGESRVATIACVRSINTTDSDFYEFPRSCFDSF
jgi:hypothetical protein